jgi:DNA modification methylase
MTPLFLLGDCLQRMDEIPSGSVDLILSDPPYGTTNAKWDTQLNLTAMWGQYKRVLKENGAVLLFAQTPFDKVLGCSNLPWLRYEIIWEKTEATGHLNAKKMPMKAHENILVFYGCLPTYNAQKTVGHIRKTALRVDRAKKQSELYGAQAGTTSYDSTERYPRSVLRFSTDKQRERYHPTQKPVALVEWLIKTYSNPGETVLDNCMGSGTTAVAAKRTGRRFIGIELDSALISVAQRRVGELSI